MPSMIEILRLLKNSQSLQTILMKISSFLISLLVLVCVSGFGQKSPSQLFLGDIEEFALFDSDGDGRLGRGEILKMIDNKFEKEVIVEAPGMELSQKFFKEALLSYLLKYDTNSDGLSKEEFGQLAQEKNGQQVQLGERGESDQFAL